MVRLYGHDYVYLTLVLKSVLVWTIFEVLVELVTVLCLFNVLVFGQGACGILFPWTGIKHTPSALEGEVSTTGPPEKSLHPHFILTSSS